MEKLYPKSKGPETESPFFGKKATSISGTTYSHQSHELPPLETLRETCVKSGHLKKLCGRGILSPGTWKDRFGLLQENQLYLYEIQDGDGKEKGIGLVIDLSHYDTVTEAPTRVTRKAANVFCLGTSDKRFFDSSGRHYFATETAAEMKGWVSALESSVGRNAGSNGTSNKGDEETTDSTTRRKNKKNTTASLKIRPETKMRSSVVPPKESEEEKSQIILGGTLPRSSGQLDCGVAKSRAKGPPGRRLPRSAAKVPPAASPSSLETLETDGGSTAPAEFRDARGRATSLSALEHHNYPSPEEGLRVQTRSSSTSRKEMSTSALKKVLEFADPAQFWKEEERRSWESDEKKMRRSRCGNSQSSFALAYHCSSSEDDGEGGPGAETSNGADTLSRAPYETSRAVSGPQVKASTPNSLRLSRRNMSTAPGGARGGTPVRHSASMTPPPCLLRKLRREMSIERTREAELELDDMGSFPDDLNGPCWKRTSSGSSLSTITPDASPYEEEQKPRNGSSSSQTGGSANALHVHLPQFPRQLTYASLQRPIGNNHSNGNASIKNHKNMLSSPTMSPRYGNCHRGSASATASPIINGRYNNGGSGHYNTGHTQQQWFQHPLERTMETVKKELGSVGQESRRLDMDMNCLRQDVDSIQESIGQVRTTLENTRERAGRLALLIGNAERQASTAVKETGVLRKEAMKLLESAEASKGIHEQLAEEAEGLLAFLRQLVAACHQSKCDCQCCNSGDTQTDQALSGLSHAVHNVLGFKLAGLPFQSNQTQDRALGPIAEVKKKGTAGSNAGVASGGTSCESENKPHRRRRQDSIESEASSSDNESSSIVAPVQKSDYHKS